MAQSFRGRFECKMDVKGRLSLPAAFRQSLDDGHEPNSLVVTNGLFKGQRCLDVYTLETWQGLEDRIARMPSLKPEVQAYQRFYLASGQVVQCDQQNRLLIPAGLRKYGDLEEEIVVVGMGKKLELWAASRWQSLYEGMVHQFEDIVAAVAAMETEP